MHPGHLARSPPLSRLSGDRCDQVTGVTAIANPNCEISYIPVTKRRKQKINKMIGVVFLLFWSCCEAANYTISSITEKNGSFCIHRMNSMSSMLFQPTFDEQLFVRCSTAGITVRLRFFATTTRSPFIRRLHPRQRGSRLLDGSMSR